VSGRKRTFIYIILLIIAAFCIWFIALDFSRFVSLDYSYDIYPSAILKRINVILAATIAWFVGKDGLSQRDSNIMKAAFIIVCFAEGDFVLGWRVEGICLFAVCQTLLLIRNSTGFGKKLKYANIKQKESLLLSGFIIFLIFAVMIILSGYLSKAYWIMLIALLYGIVLSASLWIGLANGILGLLPGRNAKMAAFGMVCFCCCDILVGLDAVLKPGLPWLLANSFIWIFYIPALVSLALSCFKYSEN